MRYNHFLRVPSASGGLRQPRWKSSSSTKSSSKDYRDASRRAAKRRLKKSLIVPDANAVHTGQSSRHFAQTRVEHQFSHTPMRIGQLQTMRKNLRVKVTGIALIGECGGIEAGAANRTFGRFQTLGDGIVGGGAPMFQFVVVEEVGDNQKTVFLIVRNVFGGKLIVHVENVGWNFFCRDAVP